MATITTAPERRTKRGLMPSLVNPAWSAGTPDREGWFAEVREGQTTLQVSRLDGEDVWTVDATFRGSFPVHANGFGARYLRTTVITPGSPAEALLDEAVPA